MAGDKRLEDLPNEILHECFKYLNAFHLFQAFDGLNHRFSALIRSTNLHLNFDQVTESMCEEFRRKASADPSINARVVSIHLSDKKSSDESDRFLANYSMEQFSQLKHLSLTDLKRSNATEFLPRLSSMPQLRYLHLDVDTKGWCYESFERLFNPLVAISINQVQQLKIAMLPKTITNPEKVPWLLEHLTIRKISFEQVRRIVQYSPNLKQMKIGCFYSEKSYEVTHPLKNRAMNLEKLVINDQTDLESLEYLFHLTPNLKDLSVIMKDQDDDDLFSGKQLEHLISFLLPNLTCFQFYFSIRQYYSHELGELPLKLREYESDFWQNHHSWKTRHEISLSSIVIYSIPYPFTKYRLSPAIHGYETLSNDLKINFDRVTDLTIDYSMIDTQSSCYFPHVKCLRLASDFMPASQRKEHLFRSENIEKLKELLPLSNVKKLFIESGYKFESPSVLVDLLTETTKMSKFGMDLQLFQNLSSTNEQFSLLIREKVKSLVSLGGEDFRFDDIALFDDSYPVEQFCEKYPHLEELSTKISHPSDFLTLLRQLPKLSLIDADMPLNDYGYSEDVADQWASELIPALLEDFHIRQDQILYHYQSAFIVVRIRRTVD